MIQNPVHGLYSVPVLVGPEISDHFRQNDLDRKTTAE